MAGIVTGEWTSVGGEGFEYYWDPYEEDVLSGKKVLALWWRHPETGHTAMCQVDPDWRDGVYPIEYVLMRRTWDLEASYRKLMAGEDVL